jgi:predicted alpha/beta hydrolase family esterase
MKQVILLHGNGGGTGHDNWFPWLKSELGKLGVACMRYAENHKLGGSVLVSTYYTDLGYEDEKAAGYFDEPWDWEAIKTNQPWTIIFASTDDPFIDISEPHLVRDKLGSEYHEFTDQEHFGHPTPKTEFPELLAALKPRLALS